LEVQSQQVTAVLQEETSHILSDEELDRLLDLIHQGFESLFQRLRLPLCSRNDEAEVRVRVVPEAHGFRSFSVAEAALYHTLGDLPEPEFIHKFC
jgi:hypothetical protein